VMARDAAKMRGDLPVVFASLRHAQGVDDVITLLREIGGL
jgi:urease accessory protein